MGPTYVRDVKLLIKPVFESMLSEAELRTLTWRVERIVDYPAGADLPGDALVRSNEAWVRWEVRGESGGTGSLRLEEGPDALVRFVQSEFQDFIAESRFGWGELRAFRA